MGKTKGVRLLYFSLAVKSEDDPFVLRLSVMLLRLADETKQMVPKTNFGANFYA